MVRQWLGGVLVNQRVPMRLKGGTGETICTVVVVLVVKVGNPAIMGLEESVGPGKA